MSFRKSTNPKISELSKMIVSSILIEDFVNRDEHLFESYLLEKKQPAMTARAAKKNNFSKFQEMIKTGEITSEEDLNDRLKQGAGISRNDRARLFDQLRQKNNAPIQGQKIIDVGEPNKQIEKAPGRKTDGTKEEVPEGANLETLIQLSSDKEFSKEFLSYMTDNGLGSVTPTIFKSMYDKKYLDASKSESFLKKFFQVYNEKQKEESTQ